MTDTTVAGKSCAPQHHRVGMAGRGWSGWAPLTSASLAPLQRRAPLPRTPCSRPTLECSSTQVVSILASPVLMPGGQRPLPTPGLGPDWGGGGGEREVEGGLSGERTPSAWTASVQAKFTCAGGVPLAVVGGQNFRGVGEPGRSPDLAGQLLIGEARYPHPPQPWCCRDWFVQERQAMWHHWG